MTIYYEKIMESLKELKFFDAINYFGQSIPRGLFTQEEIESFNKLLAEFWELVELECQKNPQVMFNLYEMLKRARNWDDKTLCKKLKISDKAIEDIKNRHKPRSEAVGLRMLYELFPQVAV
jgi:hypothetical protein